MTLTEWLDRECGDHPDDFKVDPLVVINTLIYFAAALQLGAGWWKSIVIAAIVALLTNLHYGHRALARLGVLLVVLTLALWSDILPPPEQWRPLLASIVGSNA